MDIECKLKREGGTHVDMGAEKYHFAPRVDGAHVATVTNEAHQERFLSITEAYRLYRGAAASAPIDKPVTVTAQPASDAVPALLESTVHPAVFEIHGKTYSRSDVAAMAHQASGLDDDAWNALSDEARADLIDEQLDKLEADTNGDGTVDQSEERAALVAEYEAKFSKKPNGRMSVAKIREALAAQ